jgi:hypothetical protein
MSKHGARSVHAKVCGQHAIPGQKPTVEVCKVGDVTAPVRRHKSLVNKSVLSGSHPIMTYCQSRHYPASRSLEVLHENDRRVLITLRVEDGAPVLGGAKRVIVRHDLSVGLKYGRCLACPEVVKHDRGTGRGIGI